MKFKYLIFVLLVITIFKNSPNWVFERCDRITASLSVAPIIWYEQTIDGQKQRHYLTRFLHNKPGVYMSHVGKCYFQAIDPFLLYKNLGIVGLAAFFYIFYFFLREKKHYFLTLALVLPILPFFAFPVNAQIFIYKVLSSIGIALMLKLRK